MVVLAAQAGRLLAHVAAGTTDRAASTMTVPVRRYTDPAVHDTERRELFGRRPLLLAVSGDLPAPGSFVTAEVAGTPVVAVRGADGAVRAFVNVCAHRGARVVTEPCGSTPRLTCPYHAWSYDHHGTLVGVPGRSSFGDVDPELGLTPLPCDEHAGLVFVSLDPDAAPLDAASWLAGIDEVIEPFAPSSWHRFSQRELPGANWKVVYDGYLEGYHFASLHRDTIFRSVMSNVVAHDTYGPHQVAVYPRHGIVDAGDPESPGWDAHAAVSLVVTLFPNVAFAFGRSGCLVSQLAPGPDPATSTTVQTYYRYDPIQTDDDRAAAQSESDRYFEVVRDEDYATGFAVQQGLATSANDVFTFGRNELGCQHFHRMLAELGV